LPADSDPGGGVRGKLLVELCRIGSSSEAGI